MKKLFCFCLCVFFMCLALKNTALADVDKEKLINDIKNINREVRWSTIIIIREHNVKEAVGPLILALEKEPVKEVRDEITRTLKFLTNADAGREYDDWNAWWEREGKRQYGGKVPSKVEQEFSKFRDYIVISLVIVSVLSIFVVLLIIYFTAMGSNRIKAMKEITKQAEKYIDKSEEITKRNDRIIDNIESKKQEIMEYVKEVKEDSQSEFERFADMIEKNIEHRMREITMVLREKAERELEQTLHQIKEQTERDLARLVNSGKEKMAQDLAEQKDKLFEEINSYMFYCDASFYQINGRYEAAIDNYKKLLAVKTDHHVGWKNIGECYGSLQRYTEAIQAFEQAIELSPENPAVLYGLAKIYAELKRKPKMLETLKAVFHFAPDYRDDALNDSAFKHYWDDEEFRDLTES